MVFKGGTSLSKAYRLLVRLSEDIDLAVFKRNKSNNAVKNQIKNVENVVTKSLTYVKGDKRESKGAKFRKTVHSYRRSIDGADFELVFTNLLIEINAFSNPEPFEKRELMTMIAEVLVEKNRKTSLNSLDLMVSLSMFSQLGVR